MLAASGSSRLSLSWRLTQPDSHPRSLQRWLRARSCSSALRRDHRLSCCAFNRRTLCPAILSAEACEERSLLHRLHCAPPTSKEGWLALAQLAPHLQHLELTYTWRSRTEPCSLPVDVIYPSWKELRSLSCSLSLKDALALCAGAFHFPELQQLHLDITDREIQFWGRDKLAPGDGHQNGFPTLTDLSLHGTAHSIYGVLVALPAHDRQLRRFGVKCTYQEGLPSDIVSTATRFIRGQAPTLQSVHVKTADDREDLQPLLAQLAKMTALEEVDLKGDCTRTPDIVDNLKALSERCPTFSVGLTALDRNDGALLSTGLDSQKATIVCHPACSVLGLSVPGLLVDFSHASHLHTLVLRCDQASVLQMCSLLRDAKLLTLRVLKLDAVLDDPCVDALADALANTSLEDLSLALACNADSAVRLRLSLAGSTRSLHRFMVILHALSAAKEVGRLLGELPCLSDAFVVLPEGAGWPDHVVESIFANMCCGFRAAREQFPAYSDGSFCSVIFIDEAAQVRPRRSNISPDLAAQFLYLAKHVDRLKLYGVQDNIGKLLPHSLPPEVATMDNDKVFAFMRALHLEGGGLVHRCKLMLVGAGQAGKTCLLHALRGLPHLRKSESTDGIDIVRDEWTDTQVDGSELKVQVSVWDFAGQEEYYETHPLFLSARCLYLLVWRPRRDGIREQLQGMHHPSRIHFWLKSIESCDPTATVFVVATGKDEAPNLNLGDVLGELQVAFPSLTLQLFFVSNIDDKNNKHARAGIPQLKQEIVRTAHRLGRFEMPKPWLQFAAACDAVPDKHTVFLTSIIRELAGKFGVAPGESSEMAIQVLHRWGQLHRYRLGQVSDYTVLDPQWLSDVARSLVTANVSPVKFAVASGEELKAAWAGKVKDVDVRALLDLMHQFELSFRLPDERELIPALLEAEPSPAEQRSLEQLFTADSSSQPPRLLRRVGFFGLSFIPGNLMSRIIYRTHKFTASHQGAVHSCWKNQVVLAKLANEFERQDGASSSAAAAQHYALIELKDSGIHISVVGPTPSNLCAMLSDTVYEVLRKYERLTFEHKVACPHCNEQFLTTSVLRNKTASFACNTCDALCVPHEFHLMMGLCFQPMVSLGASKHDPHRCLSTQCSRPLPRRRRSSLALLPISGM